ncbi:MAG TPA: GGDEF domain-containing protein [Bdellovibrionales bacterium]|nr:GGDEF domain-containing protein [Bdellovibrionales bacterium]
MKRAVNQKRGQFSVMIVEGDLFSAKELSDAVRSAGYTSVSFYPTIEAAKAAAIENPPHFLLFDLPSFPEHAGSFLRAIHSISPETLSIVMMRAEQALQALALVSLGVAYDSIIRPFYSSLDLVHTLDRGSAQLYYQFESEQLRERLSGKSEVETVLTPAQEVAWSENDTEVEALEFINSISSIKDLDSTVRVFLETLSKTTGESPSLYFKYLPGHASLLIAQAQFLPMEKFRGLGVQLGENISSGINQLKQDPTGFVPLAQMVAEVFTGTSFQAFPHLVEGELIGVFVVLSGAELSAHARLCAKIFETVYRRNQVLKEKHVLDTTDVLTGLLNTRHFVARIDEEIARSRRIFLPLSLITISVDRFDELTKELGPQQADVVLKVIGTVLKKTTRICDSVARTDASGFAILMPHTPHMGAAMKAERIRRMISATRFPSLPMAGSITVSCGVSEYPSFTADAESLLRSAREALDQVREAGKVCLATAPHGFKSDFVPREVPASTGRVREGGA